MPSGFSIPVTRSRIAAEFGGDRPRDRSSQRAVALHHPRAKITR